MVYRLNGAKLPSACFSPNISSVFCFGVAVNANMLRLFDRASRACWSAAARRFTISSPSGSRLSSSSRVASSRLRTLSALRTAFEPSPLCDECASSMMMANFLPGRSPISSRINGNFCNVVVMIFSPSSSACLSCALPSSTFFTTPRTCANCSTVSRSCLSSARRSVMMMTLSNTLLSPVSSYSSLKRCAVQAIVLLLPLPALCWTR